MLFFMRLISFPLYSLFILTAPSLLRLSSTFASGSLIRPRVQYNRMQRRRAVATEQFASVARDVRFH